jgi:Arc/MetJ family transcription regulator
MVVPYDELVPKTTIDISDSLLAEAKEVAAREGTTLRALVESGLRAAIDRRTRRERFRLRDASVDGDGLQPEFRDAGWDRIRDAAYEGRGA